MILLLLCIFPSAYQVVILYICKYLLEYLYIYIDCVLFLYTRGWWPPDVCYSLLSFVSNAPPRDASVKVEVS